jgi:ABC-2 type transport system ATP-binding protein
MIRVEGLTKAYGPIQALRGVSFEVQAGEIVGLLGPNGAGKSTIIKILTGYLQPDEGIVEVDGLDVLTHRLEVQARIGYLPENTPLYPDMTVQAYLKMMADLRQIPPEKHTEYISEAVYATDIAGFLNRPIGKLSKGMRQRVGLAQAILHKPRLLILDEPTIGLDPTQLVESGCPQPMGRAIASMAKATPTSARRCSPPPPRWVGRCASCAPTRARWRASSTS